MQRETVQLILSLTRARIASSSLSRSLSTYWGSSRPPRVLGAHSSWPSSSQAPRSVSAPAGRNSSSGTLAKKPTLWISPKRRTTGSIAAP